MVLSVQLLGGVVMGVGLWGLFQPQGVLRLLSRYAGHLGMQIAASAVRVALGLLLIFTAGESRFPLTFQILGGITLAAGLIFAVLPRTRFQKLLAWSLTFAPYFRYSAALALFFGGFLIYAVS